MRGLDQVRGEERIIRGGGGLGDDIHEASGRGGVVGVVGGGGTH